MIGIIIKELCRSLYDCNDCILECVAYTFPESETIDEIEEEVKAGYIKLKERES